MDPTPHTGATTVDGDSGRHPQTFGVGASGIDRALVVEGLSVSFPSENGLLPAVSDVTFHLDDGETLAIVGESGSGKSTTVRALMGIVASSSAVITGSARYRGIELIGAGVETLSSIRGDRVTMIFQDPMTSLNPVMTVGAQIAELFVSHRGSSWADGKRQAVGLLDRVAIPNARRRVDDYPWQFSGGMRQRVMIAMAIALDPDIVIADEPTTALDVTIQAQIIELLADLRREQGMSLILITHDVALVVDNASRLAVMYAGRIVEEGPTRSVLGAPSHPYTRGLLAAIPRIDRRVPRLGAIPGAPPELHSLPSGCAFNPRCSLADDACRSRVPLLGEVRPGHRAACHHADGDAHADPGGSR